MSYFISAPPRIGRSQGASIFWGLISLCFAAGACFYFWKYTDAKRDADVMRGQVQELKEDNESLQSEKTHLRASLTEEESQVKAREDMVQEKEAELAAEEMRIEAVGRQTSTVAGQNQSQVAMMKKFNDVIHKLGGATPPDVGERSGRPVLRVPNAQLFAPGDATLTPDGKTLLSQIAQAIAGQMDTFELRVACYTDFDSEADAGGAKKDPGDPQSHAASWDLTAARATALARFFRDQTQVPFLNVIVTGRGDAEPLAPNTSQDRARNRRVEITVAPLPVSFRSPEAHASDADKAATTNPVTTTTSTGTATPAQPAKNKKPDKTPAH